MVAGRPAIASAAARARFFGDWLSLPLDAECFLVDAMVAKGVVQRCTYTSGKAEMIILVVKFFLFFSPAQHQAVPRLRHTHTTVAQKPCPAALLYRDRDAQCKRDTSNEEHRGEQLQA